MATLQIIWDLGRIDDLWAWDLGNDHRTARIVKSLKPNIHLAHIGLRGCPPNSGVVILKTAEGANALHTLTKEAELYTSALLHLQGSVVPTCYGFFRGKRKGVDLGCLVLEYCSGRMPVWNFEEFNRRIMVAVCRLHEAGIVHGDLIDGHHFVKQDNDAVRIIDFSTAIRHKCVNAHPGLTYEGPGERNQLMQCAELYRIEKTYGYAAEKSGVKKIIHQKFWS